MGGSITNDDIDDITNSLKGSTKIFKTVIYGSLTILGGYFIYSYFRK